MHAYKLRSGGLNYTGLIGLQLNAYAHYKLNILNTLLYSHSNLPLLRLDYENPNSNKIYRRLSNSDVDVDLVQCSPRDVIKGGSMGGARGGSPPQRPKKREEGKRKKRKKKKREKKIKGKEQEKGKKEISIFFVYFAFLFTWVDPFGGETIICMSGCKYLSSTTEQSLARS